MQLQFNKQALHLQAVVGTLEQYKPTKEIQAVHEKLIQLRKQVEEFQTTILNKALEEIETEVEKINKKFQKKKQ